MSTAPQSQSELSLLTAEEFSRRPDPGHPEELVRGRIVLMPPPRARHGQVCCQTAHLLKRFLDDHDLGHVLSNDSGVITERGPDTVRGADVAFYSYGKVPKGPLPESYLDVPPDLVFEVVSPDDRWLKVLAKVAEYLDAGVALVGVLDPERHSLQLFQGDEPVRTLFEADELTLPDWLPGFRVAVRHFFD
jgi:Uma2 family endonuclease